MSSEDLFDDWKNHRFSRAPTFLTDQYGFPIVILSDLSYWVDHHEELELWCKEYNCHAKGMTVDFPDEETYTLFCLRWS